MNNRHLPAGQMQGGAGATGLDMGPGPSGVRGRRGPPAYAPHHYQQPVPPMYAGYVNPYNQQYYQHLPPQYQNGVMPGQYNMPFQNAYSRSPPSMQQYAPMVGVSVPPAFSRPSQQSPALNTPYQPPPAPAPVAPHTPSSTHSTQAVPPPQSPQTPQRQDVPLPPPAVVPIESAPPAVVREKFRPPLPWLSDPDVPFPSKISKSKRRRRAMADHGDLEMPLDKTSPDLVSQPEAPSVPPLLTPPTVTLQTDPTITATAPRSSTPSTQDLPSEDAPSTSPTTPSSVQPGHTSTAASITPTSASKTASRQAVPAVPIIPAVPKATPPKPTAAEAAHTDEKQTEPVGVTENVAADSNTALVGDLTEAKVEPQAAPIPAKPKLWTGLFTNLSLAAAAKPPAGPNGAASASAALASGVAAADTAGAGPTAAAGFKQSNTSALAEALRAYRVGSGEKLAFIEPRGLINAGNMCYMNSVLQVLLFCVPFYDFLDQVSKKAAHSFKGETPLIDAMIMFMKEFQVIDAAPSVDQLRRRVKSEELEQYGDPFTPEYIYEVIKKLPRFATMQRGHQQDAQEFLNFLLQSLDDECNLVMGVPSSNAGQGPIPATGAAATATGGDWLEVGRKQRGAVTRSSGVNSSTPIGRIFGGLLRSEFRVPRVNDSITTQPFQDLQLDIGAPEVRNIVDALKGVTNTETLHGDFGTGLGKEGKGYKQLFIETLPQVLILHLKRFQFDAEGTQTVKIWKKIGYPLELDIPKEVFSRQKRNSILAEGTGMPKYRLIAVVYHHGKNATTGHYTVDVRRQDGREWIRLDDTVIRRIRSEEVAEAGAEEDAAKEARKEGTAAAGASSNRFVGMNDEDTGDESGWKQVSGVNGSKRWSTVVNGGTSQATPKGKQVKESVKDNKVAYLLFYQRV